MIYSHFNPLIWRYLYSELRENSRILDVGCSSGVLGSALSELNQFFILEGVDNNQEALKIAKEKNGYCATYCLDLNNFDAIVFEDQSYDLIVFGDVLEHLINPQEVVKKILSKLKPEGIIIASLPNIAFLKYRLLHLWGKWEYTETGILDATHLRFFTFSSMKRFFVQCGLEIVESRGLAMAPSFFCWMKPLAAIWPALFALQIVFKLKLRNFKKAD